MRFRRSRSEYRALTGSSYVLASSQHYRRLALIALSIVAFSVLVGAGIRYFETHLAPANRVLELEDENRQLRTALNKARFDLEVELATRGELERQVATLNEELKQVSEELAFIKSASGRKAGGG